MGLGFSSAAAVRFDGFCLLPKQRLLMEADQPVPLGGRALDILIALIERHGELVTRRELMSRVWPGFTVVDANLSVHIAGFASSPARRSVQAIATWSQLPGRAIGLSRQSRLSRSLPSGAFVAAAGGGDASFRTMLMRLIGSADEVRTLASKLLQASDASLMNSL